MSMLICILNILSSSFIMILLAGLCFSVCFCVCERGELKFRDKANSLISQYHYFPIQAPSRTSTQAVIYGQPDVNDKQLPESEGNQDDQSNCQDSLKQSGYS